MYLGVNGWNDRSDWDITTGLFELEHCVNMSKCILNKPEFCVNMLKQKSACFHTYHSTDWNNTHNTFPFANKSIPGMPLDSHIVKICPGMHLDSHIATICPGIHLESHIVKICPGMHLDCHVVKICPVVHLDSHIVKKCPGMHLDSYIAKICPGIHLDSHIAKI